MNDKELLELSAKAYGGLEYSEACRDWIFKHTDGNYGAWWNPLTNDADAFRLAVKLNLHVDANELECVVFIHGNFGKDENGKKITCKMIEEVHGTDPLTATRRAIVRAAAEIGKSK